MATEAHIEAPNALATQGGAGGRKAPQMESPTPVIRAAGTAPKRQSDGRRPGRPAPLEVRRATDGEAAHRQA